MAHHDALVAGMPSTEKWRISCKNFLATRVATALQAASKLRLAAMTMETRTAVLAAASRDPGHGRQLVPQLRGSATAKNETTATETVTRHSHHGNKVVAEMLTEDMETLLVKQQQHHGNNNRLPGKVTAAMAVILAMMLKEATAHPLQQRLLLDSARSCNTTAPQHLHHLQM